MTQVAASWLLEWDKFCCIGSILVYILASFSPCFSSQPPLRLRDCRRETSVSRHGRQGHLPPRLFTRYDLQHIMPPDTHDALVPPSSPFYQSRRERLTRVCIASSVTNIGLSSFGIYELASFKSTKEKMSLCRINPFVVIFCLFCLFFSFTKNNKWKKESKLNVVEMFQNHPGIRCCST